MTLTRKDFLKLAAAGGLGALSGSSVGRGGETRPDGGDSGGARSAAGRPNVLVIMTDQHRADLMTCAGRDLVRTPNIDRIAQRGVRFSNAYCPYPVCVASRMAMLTGLYSHTTGAITNRDTLDWRYRTMAHHFSDAGYLTGLIGKMHFCDVQNHGFAYYMSINDWLMYLGPKVRHYANEIANHPIGPHFFDTVDDGGAGLPDVDRLWEKGSPWVGNVERWDFDDMASPLETEDHLDSFLARETVSFLRRYRDQPFFLVTSFMKPHSPFYPPREWAEKYPVDRMPLQEVDNLDQYPPHIQKRIKNFRRLGEERQRAHRAGYLGNLAFVDTCVGQVYDELENLGLADNTIVVYTSDHGEMDGDHGLYQKFCLFNPSVGVPLIVSHPGHLPQGEVTDALCEHIGLYPTLSDLAGLDQPDGTTIVDMPGAPRRMDAASFAPLCRDPDAKGPAFVFCEYNLRTSVPQYMVRGERFKYHYNHGSTHELYDLEADPGEMVNLIDAPAMSNVREEMHQRLLAWYDPETNPYRARPKR